MECTVCIFIIPGMVKINSVQLWISTSWLQASNSLSKNEMSSRHCQTTSKYPLVDVAASLSGIPVGWTLHLKWPKVCYPEIIRLIPCYWRPNCGSWSKRISTFVLGNEYKICVISCVTFMFCYMKLIALKRLVGRGNTNAWHWFCGKVTVA